MYYPAHDSDKADLCNFDVRCTECQVAYWSNQLATSERLYRSVCEPILSKCKIYYIDCACGAKAKLVERTLDGSYRAVDRNDVKQLADVTARCTCGCVRGPLSRLPPWIRVYESVADYSSIVHVIPARGERSSSSSSETAKDYYVVCQDCRGPAKLDYGVNWSGLRRGDNYYIQRMGNTGGLPLCMLM